MLIDYHSLMKNRSHCPINFGVEYFGDKWSLLIIRDLTFKNKRHYNEFLESEEHISTSVLGDKLRLLEHAGIISKKEDFIKKSRIRYSLTAKGISLLPMLIELIIWAGIFDSNTDANEEFLHRAKNSKENLIIELTQKLKIEHLDI
jgi:DNA-binding HxlR family transcriptional regulator